MIPTLGHLSAALAASGQAQEAQKLLERQLTLISRHWGDESAALVPALSNLGVLQQRGGKLEAARASLERAVALGSASRGTNHPMTARDKFRLANLLISTDDTSGVERLLTETDQALSGTGQADEELRQRTLESLAALKLARGDYAAAEALLARITR